MAGRMCDALVTDGLCAYFLDTETGSLVRAETEDARGVYTRERTRYAELPSRSSEERLASMREYVALDICWDGKDRPAQDEVRGMLERGTAIEAIVAYLQEYYPQAYDGWKTWEWQELHEQLADWLYAEPLNARDDNDCWFDDDCPCCRELRRMVEGKE